MNRLDPKTRAQILTLLCEGMAIRAITRVTGASKNTVAKLLADVGQACAAYHDQHVRGLTSQRIQMDEIWSFVYAKNDNVKRAKSASADAIKWIRCEAVVWLWKQRRSEHNRALSH